MAVKKPGRFAMPKIGGPAAFADPETVVEQHAAPVRRPGPMAVAGRDSAEALTRLAEEQAENRRRNADEAEAFRAARAEGMVLERLPITAVRTDALPRDRMALDAVAQSAEMEELKASIRARGQREAVEVWQDRQALEEAVWQLKSGWRRLEALRQLHAETGDERFATIVARVVNDEDRAAAYLAMAEENAVREDISFAEMANLAIAMAGDAASGVANADEAVSRLYGALHKVKRSNIRRFVDLLDAVGDVLPAPKDVPKNLGSDVARLLGQQPELLEELRLRLTSTSTAGEQNDALKLFLVKSAAVEKGSSGQGGGSAKRSGAVRQDRQKFEFHHSGLKVTARSGEVRIRGENDFVELPRHRLEAAIAAFKAALDG